MAKRKKKPIVILEYSDLLDFLQKNNLLRYKDNLDTFLKSRKVKKSADEIIDGLLKASLHINEADSVEYFTITAQAMMQTKKSYVGIKNPTYITSSSNEAKYLRKYVEWGMEHREFLRKQGEDYDIESYFKALGIEIVLLAWIKKQTKEVFLNTIVNKREALMANTEKRLKILANQSNIKKFYKDFTRLSKTPALRADEKETLQQVFINAVMLYEAFGFKFNYDHYIGILNIRKDDKPYYYLGDKARNTLRRVLIENMN